jgi:hypothetical protein
MSQQISIDKIVKATLSGIKKSQIQYEKWSGGFWLWNAPEYLITMNVANKISEIAGPKYITLEYGSKSTIKDAGARGKGRLPKDVREKGRVDILLWWGNDKPRAVIEIKNYIYDIKQYDKDIKRIRELLKLNSDQSSLQFALFCFCDSADDGVQKSAKQKIIDKKVNIKNKIINILGGNFQVSMKSTKIYEIEDSAWCASCILIKHKPT